MYKPLLKDQYINAKIDIGNMTITRYSIILSVCCAICWAAWILVLIFINPFEAGILGLFLFYISLAFSLGSLLSLFGIWVRIKLLKKDEVPQKSISLASRQAILFTFIIIMALILQSQRYLTWWLMLIVISFTTVIELFFISYKKLN